VAAPKASSSGIPAAISFEMVRGKSCWGAEPTWRRYWSVEMVSGGKSSASAASATRKSNEAMPWPMSKMPPRARAARTDGRTRVVPSTRMFSGVPE
jgi:hypothetical protein